jgi:hypothetical protein
MPVVSLPGVATSNLEADANHPTMECPLCKAEDLELYYVEEPIDAYDQRYASSQHSMALVMSC